MPGEAVVEMTADQLATSLADVFAKVLEEKLKPLAETQRRNVDIFERLQSTLDAHAPQQAEVPKGIRFARAAKVQLLSRHAVLPASLIAERMYKDDPILLASFKALEAQTGTAGGFLVFPQFAAEIIELVRDRAVVRAAGPRTISMPSDSMTLPRQSGGATAAYVGEGVAPAPSQPALEQLQLSAKKLIALVPVSNDLVRSASLDADAMVRDDLVQALALREDLAFLRDDGTVNKPKGIRFRMDPANELTQTGGAAPTVAQVVGDVKSTVKALSEGRKGSLVKPVWFMATRSWAFLAYLRDAGFWVFPELHSQQSGLAPAVINGNVRGGTFQGFPYFITDQIPTNLGAGTESEVYLTDMSEVVIGESLDLQLDASAEAAYDDSGTVRATFSLDQMVIRAIAKHDITLRHAKSAVVLKAVSGWI